MSVPKREHRTGADVGCSAPDFELPDADGKMWRLSDHRGKVVVLVFYPRDGTPVCTKQMCSMRDRWDDYLATGAEVVGITIATVETHKAFSDQHDLRQRLLADDGSVTRLYKVRSVLGVPQRAFLVIDGDGVIRHRKTVVPVLRPSDDEIIEAIRNC